jgi:translocation and assembly module TamB
MRRLIIRAVFVALFAILAAALGTITALVTLPPGKDLLARLVSEESNRLVRGSVSIGRIRGDFLTGLTLDSVVIRDTAGVALAEVPRLSITFRLANLIARRILFHEVRAIDPRIVVIKHRGGRMNYQEIFKLGEGSGGTGPPSLFQLDDLVIENGQVTIWNPWNPDGRLKSAGQRDSALTAERAKPGRRIELGTRPGDGLMLVRTIVGLEARFTTMVISSPDRKPFHTQVDSLSARLSDPAVAINDLKGTVSQGGDSLLFQLERIALPNTVMRGGGRLDWPADTVLYHFDLNGSPVDLVDLRWVSPDFPAFRGRGRVRANSLSGTRTEYGIRGLDVGDATSRVRGSLVAILDVHRGLGFRDLDLDLENLDLEAVRPYLDTLPFQGRLTGPLRATGFFDAMTASGDWTFDDAAVEGGARNYLAFEGDLTLGGPDGMDFHGTRITSSDFDLRTIRLVTPAVLLDGRLSLQGSLEGPWRNVVYQGRVEHRDGERPLSAITGRARLDTRGAVLALDANLTLDTLSFDGLRGSFPTLPMRGAVSGTANLVGPLDSLTVALDLAGPIGRYRVTGLTALEPPRWGATGLRVEFTGADLAGLSGTGPRSRLAGLLELTGEIDSLVAPEVDLTLRLRAGSLREFAFDSARARLRIRDSLVRVDTALAWWEGGSATASGGLGWAEPHRDSLRIGVLALSLAPFDSLAAAVLAVSRLDSLEQELMSGRARGSAVIAGSLDHWRMTGEARADSAAWIDLRTRVVRSGFTIAGGRRDSLELNVNVTADTVVAGRRVFADLAGEAAGRRSDLEWSVRGKGGGQVALGGEQIARVSAGGGWRVPADSSRILSVDSLDLTVLGRSWRLNHPATFAIDSVAVADTVAIVTADGSGSISLTGVVPGRSPGALEVRALGISLRDVYALAQRDTAGVAGLLAIDARVGGTSRDPTFRGSATITGPVVGDLKAPLVRSVFNYEDRLLQSNLTFWRTGRSVLDVDATLPIDLGVGEVDRRQLPGQLVIRAHTDSVDLGVIEALTPNVRAVVGSLAVDAQVEGTWDRPRLGGFVQVTDGALFVPGLGVGYGPMHGRIRLTGDSLVADSVEIHSGIGVARVRGGVRLERLTRPILGLEVSASEFAVMDVADYLTLHATGDVSLTGPIARPVLTGSVRATNSVLYFADLISKDIVNLEDPANADLVDTVLLRSQKLGAQFQSRFLDSLTIRDLGFRVGQDVWLRSGEANVQLEGQVTVNKGRRIGGRSRFQVSGQFTTTRGTYTLKLGPVFRTFTVEQGTVQYLNTEDLNANLDLAARHVVRTVTTAGSEDYPIIARITGTLLAPKLELRSEPGRQPLPERDLVSLLVFGTTSSGAIAGFGPGAFVNQGVLTSIAATALSSEISQAILSSRNAPIQTIEIRPGFAQGNTFFATGGTVTSLSLGRQLSRRLFVTFNLGGCLQRLEFNRQYLGATLEYRLHPSLKLQVAAEPVQSCLGDVASTLTRPSRYQFGADLKWDREY